MTAPLTGHAPTGQPLAGHAPTGQPLFGQALADADAVTRLLEGTAPLGVAYSGGVDSAVLLALAVRALGHEGVVALMGVSPSLAADERGEAHAVATHIGATLVEFATFEGENPAYRANDVDRCFHCKDELFTRISADVAAEHALATVAYGENADDALRPDRPGAQAATNHAVRRPLAEAGLTKARVRAIARALDLPCADKPAAPCLASRIPHGEEVTPEKLAQVEAGERALRGLGFSDSRVRHHGDIARIEVPTGQIGRFADDEVRATAVRALRDAGFRHVTVDLAGIRSGAFTLEVLARRA
ncbi:MAG: ATP-dependent sacrificial sulfur transferase LarE [Actinomycetota bacterium]